MMKLRNFLSNISVILIVTIGASVANAQCWCSGCGCKGGPGYRDTDNHCVSHKDLTKKCGVPPSQRCTYEGAKQICPSERRGGSGRVDPLLAPEPLAGQVAPRPEPGLSDVFVRRILLDQ